jgi:hypothetical protein
VLRNAGREIERLRETDPRRNRFVDQRVHRARADDGEHLLTIRWIPDRCGGGKPARLQDIV